jgi:PAS domain S-box-containing protein
MDPQPPSASPSFAVPLAGGEDAPRATLSAALEALEMERAARLRAEDALLERDRKLAEVERLASLGSWEQAIAEPLDQQPVRWSAEHLRIHGLDPEHAPATFAEFLARVHPDDRGAVAEACAAAAQSGDASATSYRVVRADGELRWLYAHAQRVQGGGGPPRLIGTARDVTEHHLAAAALNERERTLDEVEALAGLGTWEWHLPSDTITWSREQRRIHGLGEGTARQSFQEFLDHVHPEDRGRVVEECERLIATGEPFSFPYRVVRPDGSFREMNAVGKLLPDPARPGARMVGISRDVTRRNAAERALRESEARFRDLFEQFPHSVKVYAPDGRVVRVNAAYERLWGLTLEQVAQFNPLRDVGMAEIGEMVRRAFDGETVVLPAVLFDPREYSADHVPPEGEWPRWVQASYFPIRGADGEVLEVVAVHQDVTDQRVAEEALRISEDSYRTIFENSNDAIFVTDGETGVVVDANRRACQMADATLDELRADAAAFIWNGPAPYTAERAREQSRRAAAGEAQTFEWMSVHPRTGAPIWGEVSLQRVVLAGKVRILALVRDISERKAAEEALRSSEESYRTLFELSNDPIYVHDVETGAILDANRRACEAAGMTLEQVREGGLQLLTGGPPPFTRERALEHLRLAAEGTPQRFEWMTGVENDGQVWSEVSLSRVTIGGVDRLVATARDITERKAAEQALRDREESYRTIFDAAGAGIWVHELETGAFLDVNQTACELYGWSVEEQKALGVEGISWGEPPYTVAEALQYVRRAIDGEPQRFEWKGRHRDGRPVWAEITLRRVTILGEERLLATARETSEWKAAEDALRRANEELEARVRERTAELAEANEALEEEVAEHEAAQEALLERTQELEGVFHALPDLYFRLDPDGTITDHRAGRAATVYAPLPDFRGQRMQELLPDEAGVRFDHALREATRTGALECVEYRLMDGDTALDFEARVVPLADYTLITVVRDISERKAAERELERRRREAEQVAETLRQQALVFETLAEAVVITSAEGRITDWNPAAERMFGYPRKAIVGRAGGLVNPPGREPGMTTAVMAALEHGGGWSGEVPFTRPDGTPGVAEAVVVPQHDETGRRIALISAHRDITERRTMEEALRRSEEHFRRLTENAQDMVQVVSAEGIVQYTGPSVVRLLGYTPDEIAGTPATDYIHPDDLPRVREVIAQILSHPGRPITPEYRVRHRDGSYRTMEAICRTLSPDTADDGIVVNARDVTERKQAEAEVVRQKAFFEEIIASLESGVAVFDPQLRYTYASPNSVRDPEVREWVVGRTVREYGERKGLPEQVIQVRQDGIERALRLKKTTEFEEELRAPDGSTRNVIRRSLPVLDENGEVLRIIGYSVDITERVRIAQVLRQSEEHFRALIENSHDIVCILDPLGTMTYQSPSLRRLLGWEPEEMIGRSTWEFIHPDDVARVVETMAAILHEPGSSKRVEYRFQRKDGQWRTVEAIGRTLAPDTADQGLVANIRDVTERRLAERALQEREEHFRRLIENAHDITCILDPQGVMTYLSPSIQRVLGYPPEALVGRNSFDYIHPDDAAGVAGAIRSVMSSPTGTGFAEYRFRHADGGWRHLEAVGRMVVPGEPESGFVSNIRDVTERRHAEEALREATLVAERARAEAERANLAKSEFLSRMSHELRTPMNSILGFGQVLARAELRMDQQKHVQHILKAGRHLLRLINEVLEIARIEAGRQSFSLEPVHVGTVMQEAVGLVRPMAEQHGVEVEEGPGTGRDGFVHADRQRLTQVLLNLLSNAIKYNHEGGRVRLTCEAGEPGEDGEPQVWLRVEDSGQGIPEAKMHQLFTPFARLGAEQTEVEGTGLGLALSLRLAEAMGGTLELERSGPEGSVFRLGLHGAANPLRRAEDAGLPAAPAEGAEGYAPATLLYVEDNLANLSLVETFLMTRPGWRLIPALQGRIGVELAREHRPDLVLLDLHLPDLTGDEVLRRLRADPRTSGIPIIIISADATRDSLERLRAAGADAYLTKPLDLDEFLATLELHLPVRPGDR